MTDDIPAGFILGTVPAGCEVTGQRVNCVIPAGLAAQDAVRFIIPVTPTEVSDSVVNTALVLGGGDTGCPGDQARCTASVETPVTGGGGGGEPRLRLTKQAQPETFVPGAGELCADREQRGDGGDDGSGHPA